MSTGSTRQGTHIKKGITTGQMPGKYNGFIGQISTQGRQKKEEVGPEIFRDGKKSSPPKK